MKWISVKDRLPSVCSDVLVWVENGDNGYPRLAWMHDDGVFVSSYDYIVVWGLSVTHWMPLPGSPED